jgi:ankyrin repeat protein
MQTDAPPSVPPTHPNYPPNLLTRAITVYILDSSAANQQDQDNALATIREIVEVHGPRCLNWAQVNILDEGDTLFTPLQFACANPPDVPVIKLLLRLRARPDVCNSRGEDALTFATRQAGQGHEAVAALLKAGVHPLKHKPVLIEPGACTQLEDPSGRIRYVLEPDQETQLPRAFGKAIRLAFCTDHGLDANPMESHDLMCRAFMHYCDRVNPDECEFMHGSVIGYFLDMDTSIENPTLLFMMLRKGYTNSVNYILDHFYAKADPNRGRDMFGNTPLHYAVTFYGMSVVEKMLRNGADMFLLSGGRGTLPHPLPELRGLTRRIGRTPVTPANLLAVPVHEAGHLILLDFGSRLQLSKNLRKLSRRFRFKIIPMWLWHVKPQHTQLPRPLSRSQVDRLFRPALPSKRSTRWPLPRCWKSRDSLEVVDKKARKQWHRQCKFRGSAFHGWHRLPREVVRIIIGHIMPKFFHPLALDARLQRFTEAYHRGVDARRRRLADVYNTVSSTRLLCYTEAWHRDH